MPSGGPTGSSLSATSLLLPILISAAAGAAVSSAAWLFATTPRSVRTATSSTTTSVMPPPESTSSTSLATRDSADNAAAAAALGSTDSTMAARPAESQNLLNLLYSIAEDQARKEGYVHRGITCNHCGSSPIRGTRFKCSNCVDFDVCENCEAQEVHNKTHVFLKIRIPIPPLANPRTALLNPFYPGNRHGTTSTSLDTFQVLQSTTHFDQLELEALDDQFRALATSDRGIPRSVYDQSLGPLGLEKNLITDRIFAFFDMDRDGFINFMEFIRGLSVLCKGTLDEKIVAAFHGYDLDGDGKITRQELHAMFKAYFHLSMELVRDVVKAMEEEMMATFDEDANKPVSAAFTAPIPANAQGQQGQQSNQAIGGAGGGGSQRAGSSRGGQRPSGGWQKGDDPDALMSGTSPSSFTSPVHASSTSAMATNAPAASSSSSSGRLLGPGHQIADDAGFLSGGEDGGQSVPPTPIGSGFQWGASTSSSSHPSSHHHHHHHDRDPLSATSAHPPSSSAFLQTHRASTSVSQALAAAARRANSMAVASGTAGRHMSLDIGSPLGAHGAHEMLSPGAGATGDRLQPIMEQMSQEAIAEMVDKTFAAMDVEGKGWAAFEDFKRHVEMDPTIVNWFETLSSIF